MRVISASTSRSHHMFSALAAATMSAVPASESSSRAVATCPGARQAPAAPVQQHERGDAGLRERDEIARTTGQAGRGSAGGRSALRRRFSVLATLGRTRLGDGSRARPGTWQAGSGRPVRKNRAKAPASCSRRGARVSRLGGGRRGEAARGVPTPLRPAGAAGRRCSDRHIVRARRGSRASPTAPPPPRTAPAAARRTTRARPAPARAWRRSPTTCPGCAAVTSASRSDGGHQERRHGVQRRYGGGTPGASARAVCSIDCHSAAPEWTPSRHPPRQDEGRAEGQRGAQLPGELAARAQPGDRHELARGLEEDPAGRQPAAHAVQVHVAPGRSLPSRAPRRPAGRSTRTRAR